MWSLRFYCTHRSAHTMITMKKRKCLSQFIYSCSVGNTDLCPRYWIACTHCFSVVSCWISEVFSLFGFGCQDSRGLLELNVHKSASKRSDRASHADSFMEVPHTLLPLLRISDQNVTTESNGGALQQIVVLYRWLYHIWKPKELRTNIRYYTHLCLWWESIPHPGYLALSGNCVNRAIDHEFFALMIFSDRITAMWMKA